MRVSFRHLIFAVVFIMGAGVLAIELVATRLLSVYFGGTIFTLSGVLSIILGALSVGYYLGGKLGDNFPTRLGFFSAIFVGGLGTLVIQILSVTILPIIGTTTDPLSGPIITGLLLFFIPSIVLGTSSPYAIAVINKEHPEGVGTLSGTVFLWSTLGSIAGSLLTGFVLVSLIGLNAILVGAAIIITLIGVAGLWPHRRHKRVKQLLVTGGAIWLLWFAASLQQTKPLGLLFQRDGLYERIFVWDGKFEGQPTRFLIQDQNMSSASRLGSDELVYGYTKYAYMLPELKPDAKSALVVGGGNYSVPRYLLKAYPEATIHVSEIEPTLYDLSKQYFELKDDPRLINHVTDGRRILRDDRQYDDIFGDAFHSALSIPTHLTTKEHFQELKATLKPDGVYMVNIIGSLRDTSPSYALSQLRTFKEVFPNTHVFAVDGTDRQSRQNIMVIGINGYADITKDAKPNTQAALAHRVNLDELNLARHATFTDDFAPTDFYLAVGMLRGEE